MRMMLKICWLCLLFSSLMACGGSPAQVKKYYRIQSISDYSQAAGSSLTLVIKRPSALSILGNRPMVATNPDGALVQLSHHFWLESPKILLQDQLKKWAKNRWQSVTESTPNHDKFETLVSRILAFEKNQTEARVTIEFKLYDSQNQLKLSKQLSHNQSLKGPGFDAFAAAVSQAIDHIIVQFDAALIP